MNTTDIGYRNRNDQKVLEKQAHSENHRFAKAYLMQCQHCDRRYRANGCDIFQRKCPDCQGGEED